MKRVLVVDDDPLLTREIKEELEFMGFRVDVAHTYTEAVKAVGQNPSYDVVSLDMMMRILPDEEVDREDAGRGVYTGLEIYKKLQLPCATSVLVMTVLEADDTAVSRIREVVGTNTVLLNKTVSLSEYVASILSAAGVKNGNEKNGGPADDHGAATGKA